MKKCLVLDLDNTLWGGIVGEDGPDGIQLSLSAPGSSFVAFQQALMDHYNRGVLLAINSRNNPDDALAVIRQHPNMILKENHFAAMRINWQDKAQNLRELADELNIGLDAMVFLDDDPTNRALVRAALPEVETPDLPEPSAYARFLNSLDYFASEAITDEDKMRGSFYVTERLRNEAQKRFTSKDAFLQSLGLELAIMVDDEASAARLAQLTEKTNQFNTRKEPLSGEGMRALMQSADHRIYAGRLTDTFGNHGIIALAIVQTLPESWHISSMLMSCRVFDRGVEEALLARIAQDAQKTGARALIIAFVETEKNMPAKTFVEKYFANATLASADAPRVPAWITIV